jgi:GNAT superfamily N-acetyltransferase
MDVTIRRAVPADAPVLAELRLSSHLERNGGEAVDFAGYRRESEAAFAEFLTDGSMLAWLAFDGALAVGSAALLIQRTMPRAGARGEPGRRIDGRIRNVRVEPAYRRRGIASALMRAATAEAERIGVDRLVLGTSTMGRPLYESLGWVHKDDEMVYRFAENKYSSTATA